MVFLLSFTVPLSFCIDHSLLDFQALEDKERKQEHDKERLAREQRLLRQRLDQLTNGYRIRIERSVSECSSSQLSTSSTSSYESYESGK